MENNFDIHNWQAKHLKKVSLNEQITQDTVALEVKRHLKIALDIMEEYKEANQIASNENPFNDVEVDIEEALYNLGHLG
jgi:hypothetical protein